MKRLFNKQLVKCANAIKFINMTKTAERNAEHDKKTIDAIDSLVNNNDCSSIEFMYEDIMVENKDCLYNGTVYRKIIISFSKFNRLKNVGEKFSIVYNKIDVLNKCYTNITAGTAQSTSKSLECCRNFTPEDDYGVEVIITFECKQGLDIQALAEKYKKIMNDLFEETKNPDYESMAISMDEIIQQYADEQEVFCMVPNDFKIYSINGYNVEDLGDTIEKKFLRNGGF